MCWDDEVIETTTTVTHHDVPNVVGILAVQLEGTQPFVIDPADSQKTWVNSNDDMYEDADGRIWRLKAA